MKKNKRKVIALFFLILFMLSFVFTIVEHHHECDGEHCSICMQIRQNEENLKELGVGIEEVVKTVVVFLPVVVIALTVYYELFYNKTSSLVGLKVLLRD